MRRHHRAPDDRRRYARARTRTATSHATPSDRERAREVGLRASAGCRAAPGSRCASGPTIQPGSRAGRGPRGSTGRSAATSTMAAAQADDGAHRRGAEGRHGGPRGGARPSVAPRPTTARQFEGDVRARARHESSVRGGRLSRARSTRLAPRARSRWRRVRPARGRRSARARCLERRPRELAARAALARHLAARVADPDERRARRPGRRARPRCRRRGGRRATDASSAACVHHARLGRRQARRGSARASVRSLASLTIALRGGRQLLAGEARRRSCAPNWPATTAPSAATASSPATRAIALLTPDAMPALCSSASASTVAVSGATVGRQPEREEQQRRAAARST